MLILHFAQVLFAAYNPAILSIQFLSSRRYPFHSLFKLVHVLCTAVRPKVFFRSHVQQTGSHPSQTNKCATHCCSSFCKSAIYCWHCAWYIPIASTRLCNADKWFAWNWMKVYTNCKTACSRRWKKFVESSFNFYTSDKKIWKTVYTWQKSTLWCHHF